MPAILRSRLKQRGSIFIMFTLMLMTVIIPMAGLAIDLTIMYVIQAKLWEAVDGAALEAGRLIGVQYAPIQSLAVQACTSNFPNGYWAASTPSGAAAICDPANIIYTPASAANSYVSSVSVTASAAVPLLFMRVFQLPNAVVAATGTASRRSVRVEILIDRSGSMSGVLSTVLGAAASFATRFNAGYDEMGYIPFGTSGVIAYPFYKGGYSTTYTAGNWSFNPNNETTGYSGPDNGFNAVNGANSGGTTCCDMISAINNTALGLHTNTPEALSLAYIELQKAHIRDVNANGGIDPIQNNVIVLFTDGVPDAFTVYVNGPDAAGTSMSPDVPNYPVPYATTGMYFTPASGLTAGKTAVLQPGNALLRNPPARTPISAGSGYSGCTYNAVSTYNTTGTTVATAGANPIFGVIVAQGNPAEVVPVGPFQVAPLDGTKGGGTGTSSWSYYWTQHDTENNELPGSPPGTPATNNCNELATTSPDNNNALYNGNEPDLKIVPTWDFYGNSTAILPNTNGYHTSSNSQFLSNVATASDTGTINGNNATAIGQQLAIASWNATDNAGWNIRSDTTTMKVLIYTIGYSGDGGTDDGLLAKVANDPAPGTTYANTDEYPLAYAAGQRQGKHFPASDTNAVADAFNTIAGMLLGLTR